MPLVQCVRRQTMRVAWLVAEWGQQPLDAQQQGALAGGVVLMHGKAGQQAAEQPLLTATARAAAKEALSTPQCAKPQAGQCC